jgi:predicted metal-dependent phosphoesterase TrpH
MPLLVAVEMSTLWRGEMTDLLCYGFDPERNTLLDLSLDLLRRQQENSREVYANLQRKGVPLPEDPQVLANILAMPSPEQPHGLVALLKSLGYGQGEPSAGRMVQEAGCAYASNDLAAVVEAGHQCRALCLVAHPGRGDGFVDFDAPLLDELRQEVPIDGLEVWHTRHTPAKSEMFLEYARRQHLLVSSGSDSHGADKPPVKYRADQSRDLLDRLGIRVG